MTAGPRPGRHVYRQLDDIAAKVPPGSNGAIFTPWLNGERSPVDDHTIRAGFHNLSLSTSRRDMVRAVYEGVALNTRWLLGAVERFVGRRFDDTRLHRRRSQLDALGPDPRRCHRPPHPSGHRPGPRQRARCGAAHLAGARTGARRRHPGHGRRWARPSSPTLARADVYDSSTSVSSSTSTRRPSRSTAASTGTESAARTDLGWAEAQMRSKFRRSSQSVTARLALTHSWRAVLSEVVLHLALRRRRPPPRWPRARRSPLPACSGPGARRWRRRRCRRRAAGARGRAPLPTAPRR